MTLLYHKDEWHPFTVAGAATALIQYRTVFPFISIAIETMETVSLIVTRNTKYRQGNNFIIKLSICY